MDRETESNLPSSGMGGGKTPRGVGAYRQVNPAICGELFKIALVAIAIVLFIMAMYFFR